MRRALPILALLLALTASASAQLTTITYESLTIGASAVGLSATTLVPAAGEPIRQCRGRLETAQIRQRWDGTSPTASEGELVEIGEFIDIASAGSARDVRWIRTGSTSGVLKVTCWR